MAATPGAVNSIPDDLLATLKARFEGNPERHLGLQWSKVQARLGANAGALRALGEMERTGGEPDVVILDEQAHEYVFADCRVKAGLRFRPAGPIDWQASTRIRLRPSCSHLGANYE